MDREEEGIEEGGFVLWSVKVERRQHSKGDVTQSVRLYQSVYSTVLLTTT